MKISGTTGRLTGTRIRERRLGREVAQVALAAMVDISPAYLNLIEHNKRRIGGKLLVNIARALGAEPGELSQGAETALLGVLSAAGARYPEVPTELSKVGEFAGRFPGWAGVTAAQHARIRELERLVEALSDRLTHDPHLAATLHEVLSTVTAIHSAVSILTEEGEVDPDWQARFLRNVAEDSARLSASAQGLVGYLEAGTPGAASHISPQEELSTLLERHAYVFADLEAEGGGDVTTLVDATEDLESQAARELASDWLCRYRRDAARLPAREFARIWLETGGDPVRVAAHFGVDIAAILRRAACVESTAPPVGLVICDGTGTLTTRKEIPGFAVPRFGAACPRWPLYQAMAQPGVPLRAVVEMPGDPSRTFTCLAICTADFSGGLDALPVYEATMLILPVEALGGVVGEVAESHVSVGPGCRVCPRAECPARREKSLLALET